LEFDCCLADLRHHQIVTQPLRPLPSARRSAKHSKVKNRGYAMLNLPITLVTAGLCGLLFFILSLQVVRARLATKVTLGDGGDPTLFTRIRTHGNFAEYVPLSLILLAVCEISGVHRLLLAVCGALIVLTRVAHVLGMPRPAPNMFRVLGTAGSWLVIVVLSLYALLLGLGLV
jgi:uncharacterized protein